MIEVPNERCSNADDAEDHQLQWTLNLLHHGDMEAECIHWLVHTCVEDSAEHSIGNLWFTTDQFHARNRAAEGVRQLLPVSVMISPYRANHNTRCFFLQAANLLQESCSRGEPKVAYRHVMRDTSAECEAVR